MESPRKVVLLLLVAAGFAIGAIPIGAVGTAQTLREGLAMQIALDREGFSPGVIDGRPGAKTTIAMREYQASRGEPIKPLAVDAVLRTYTITAADVRQVGPNPRSWVAKSKLSRLAYPSLDQLLAEKFHCTRALLATLNPGVSLTRLKAGQTITAPNVAAVSGTRGASVQVHLAQKIVRVLDSSGRVVAMFHCSVAADKGKLPKGNAKVVVVSPNPVYGFDPKMWPDVKSVSRKLLIPPGPRNPVGLCWVGLSLPGYGIHGTPAPEMIGKTGSHGCIRLANWDAVRFGQMAKVGMPVTFVQ